MAVLIEQPQQKREQAREQQPAEGPETTVSQSREPAPDYTVGQDVTGRDKVTGTDVDAILRQLGDTATTRENPVLNALPQGDSPDASQQQASTPGSQADQIRADLRGNGMSEGQIIDVAHAAWVRQRNSEGLISNRADQANTIDQQQDVDPKADTQPASGTAIDPMNPEQVWGMLGNKRMLYTAMPVTSPTNQTDLLNAAQIAGFADLQERILGTKFSSPIPQIGRDQLTFDPDLARADALAYRTAAEEILQNAPLVLQQAKLTTYDRILTEDVLAAATNFDRTAEVEVKSLPGSALSAVSITLDDGTTITGSNFLERELATWAGLERPNAPTLEQFQGHLREEGPLARIGAPFPSSSYSLAA